jgi:predicted nucleic acid-binding protein
MPGARLFVDTNILLYMHDRRNVEKANRASAWLQALTSAQIARINLQVLNELAYVLLKKKWYDTVEAVFSIVDDFAALGDTPLTWRDIERARGLHADVHCSWWDCLLLASAIELGCTHFLSEDLQDGQVIKSSTTKGLTIVDPFAHTPEQILVFP